MDKKAGREFILNFSVSRITKKDEVPHKHILTMIGSPFVAVLCFFEGTLGKHWIWKKEKKEKRGKKHLVS